jgi:hypothetical protein
MMAKDDSHWMEDAAASMKKRGTLGSFGKATPKKIAAGKKKGGKAEKKAIFAKTAKKVAEKKRG